MSHTVTSERAVRFYHRLRSQLSADYYMIMWVFLIFLVAGINAATILYLINYYLSVFVKSATANTALGYFALSAIVYFAVGLVASIVATRLLPAKRIVMPLLSQIITVVLLIPEIYAENLAFPQEALVLTMVAFVGTLFFGLLQDMILIGLVGRAIVRGDIPTFSLKINATLEQVRKIFLMDRFADSLGIMELADEHEENAFARFKSLRATMFGYFIDLSQAKPNESYTSLDLALYDRRAYTLIRTEAFEEYGETKYSAIQGILKRSKIEYEELTDRVPEDIVDHIILENSGILERSEYRVSGFRKVKIGLFILLLAIGLGFAFFGTNEQATLSGWGIFAAVLGIGLLIEAPKRVSGRRSVR